MIFNFIDRASYKVAIKAWAQNYRDLSQQIRDAKVELKETMRAGKDAWSAILKLGRLRIQAQEQLDWRHASKIEAHSQYLAQKASH